MNFIYSTLYIENENCIQPYILILCGVLPLWLQELLLWLDKIVKFWGDWCFHQNTNKLLLKKSDIYIFAKSLLIWGGGFANWKLFTVYINTYGTTSNQTPYTSSVYNKWIKTDNTCTWKTYALKDFGISNIHITIMLHYS